MTPEKIAPPARDLRGVENQPEPDPEPKPFFFGVVFFCVSIFLAVGFFVKAAPLPMPEPVVAAVPEPDPCASAAGTIAAAIPTAVIAAISVFMRAYSLDCFCYGASAKGRMLFATETGKRSITVSPTVDTAASGA